MPTTGFPEYARAVADALDVAVSAGQASLTSLQVDHRSPLRGLISGMLVFEDGSELHFNEFVDTTIHEPRVMYAYHYQDAGGALVFRYDNAAHRPSPSKSEHKHTPDGVIPSEAPTLLRIIDEILQVGTSRD
jgi:hypothetical protein